MATNAETLLSQAKCHICHLSPGHVWYAILAALCHIRDIEPMSTDAKTLMNEAKCLMCKIPPGVLPYAILATLCSILTDGALGGSVSYGTSDPTETPTGDSGIYYRTDTGAVWIWNSATSSWDPIIV